MSNQDQVQQNNPQPLFVGLPYEPGSTAELLFSTHIFAVDVLTLSATPWTVGDDELEHRHIRMEMRLVQIFKGTLKINPNEQFQFEVEQQRESEFFVTDFHGLWSHSEPDAGVKYVIFATGMSDDPAPLMQEPNLQALLDRGYLSDIRVALEAEQLFQEISELPQEDSHFAAVQALLQLSQAQRSEVKDVFGRYLWERINPVFLAMPDDLLPDLLALITAVDVTQELRRVLIERLYESVLLLETNLELFQAVTKAYFALLHEPSAQSISSTLVEIQLYNLVFREEQPRFLVQTILPELPERNALKSILAQFDSDRARALVTWLDSNS